MQKNGKKIFEDDYILSILESTFLTGIDKIQVLDKCLSFFDDIDVAEEYLITWQKKLTEIIENPIEHNRQGYNFKEKVSRYRSEEKGEAGYNSAYNLLVTDARLHIEGWDHKYFDKYKVVYQKLGLGATIDLVELKETLIDVTNNWDLSSFTIYYKKPLIWVENRLAELAKPMEQPESIKVNIVASQFMYLLKKLHEEDIITLPVHKSGDINMLSTAKVILSVFHMIDKNNHEVVNSAKLLSANLNGNPCGKLVKKDIENSVGIVGKIATKTRKGNI